MMEGVSLNMVDTWEEAESFMTWLSERRPFMACDTETGGFDWWRDELRMVQFGDCFTGWSIPFERGGWGGLVKDVLRRYSGDLVFHNMKFDLKYLETNGCTVAHDRLQDTRSMAHILYPNKRTGLKELAAQYVDGGAENGQTDLKRGMTVNKWSWATVPVDFGPYWIYAALDPVLTARLYERFNHQITGDLRNVYELEIACQIILDEMERRGARIDVPYCAEKQSELVVAADVITQWCVDTYGFGPGSNAQVASQLNHDGIILTKRTPGGAWSVDDDVLSDVGITHPLAKAVLDVRKARKMANSYFGNYIEYADGDMLHCDVNPLGAATGRMSVSRPALQQIPRTKLLRDPFIPREGNKLISVDFDQMEMRLLTHFSGDQGLLNAFQQDGDFFTNTARLIYGDPTIEKSDFRRQLTKNASYAKAYGSGVEKFALTAGIPVDQAQPFIATYDATFPGVRGLQQSVDMLARNAHASEGVAYVTTPLGRREAVDYLDWTYKLTNYLIQGTAADIFKQTLVDLDRAGLADRLILPVHDEALFDVPAEDAEEFATEAVKVFQARGDWAVQLTSGSDILDRWGDKYK